MLAIRDHSYPSHRLVYIYVTTCHTCCLRFECEQTKYYWKDDEGVWPSGRFDKVCERYGVFVEGDKGND